MGSRIVTQRVAGSRRCLGTAANQWRQVISEKNPSINALVYSTPAPEASTSRGPFSGVAVAVKDNIATYDSPTTCSSAMLDGKLVLSSQHLVY
jgi:aspartyl-tRNA(Asn)/glutamyl-tRNA(Gln) amidotransferase subunit A